MIKSDWRDFFAFLADGSLVTWGEWAPPPSEIQKQLQNVDILEMTMNAFAAVLDDGSVVTWGSPFDGANSKEVQDRG